MQTYKLKYFSLAAAALLILSTTGCTSFRSSYIKSDNKIFNINANGKSKISISEPNGEVRITGSDSISAITIIAQIFVSEEKTGNNALNKDIMIKIDTTGSRVFIKTDYDRGIFKTDDPGYVNYDIIIPKSLSVDISNVNGDIFLTSVESESVVETVNSTVNILNCSGKVRVDGVNSDIISNTNLTDGLSISVVNGDIKLGGIKNVDADVKISTINGDVSFEGLTFSNIKINGRKSFKGSIGNGGKLIDVSTVNGDIKLDGNYIIFNKK